MRYYGIQNEVKAYLNRLQSETSIQITPSIVKTLNDRVESLKKSGVWSQYGLGFNDTEADSYFQRASVNDVIGRSEVCWFVRGMKSLGLWQNMVSWPLRSYQNAGTGSTVYSLGGLGTFNGTTINSPTWGVNGLVLSSSVMYISTTFNMSVSNQYSIFSAAFGPSIYQGYFARLFEAAAGSNFIVVRNLNNSSLNAYLGQQTYYVNGVISSTIPTSAFFTSLVTFSNSVNTTANLFGAGSSSWANIATSSAIFTKILNTKETLQLHNIYKYTIGSNLSIA